MATVRVAGISQDNMARIGAPPVTMAGGLPAGPGDTAPARAYRAPMPVPLTSVELLERLIAFDTQSFRSNLELVAFVQDHLDGLGVASRLVHDGTGTKANLWAMVGPADVPGIVLSGHTDVVPVAGQDWTSDPFRAEIRDGRLYGRGAADMKGFLACVLALVPDLVGASLRKPAILAFSYDEEVGCKGVPGLIEALLAELPRPEACLVGEPTLMRLVDGHKGKAGYRCSITGREAHSALPHLGANAVVAAARIIDRVASMGRRFAAEGPFLEGFDPPHHTSGVGRIEAARSSTSCPTAAASSSSSARSRARTRCASSAWSRSSRASGCCRRCVPRHPRPGSRSRRSWPTRAWRRLPTRLSGLSAASSPARPTDGSPSAPRAAATPPAASRPWSAARATSASRTSPTSGSPSTSSTAATPSCAGSRRALLS